jgi:hypothetical protein
VTDAEDTLDDEDVCGLCGEPGADKFPHQNYWPTERRPDARFVHADCEQEECGRAFVEYRQRVGEEGVSAFLRSIR